MISQFQSRLWKCSTGAVAVLTAIVLPVLLGFASLGVEAGHWYLGQRTMQGAADAAAISAASQYVVDFPTDPTSTTYQRVGVNYANYNGFAIPAANVCLIPITGPDNCGTVRSLDPREIVCPSLPCIIVEITQDTGNWLTTKMSLEPGPHVVQGIPHPTLYARAVVSAAPTQRIIPGTTGGDCILALANSTSAVQVSGSKANLRGNCGVAIDGGLDQNPGTPVGGISFNGSGAQVNITSLTAAANSTGGCPSASHCFLYSSGSQLKACSPPNVQSGNCIATGLATPDPYTAVLNFTDPLGVNAITIATAGRNYPKNATCHFTVNLGSGAYYVTDTPSPTTFTATTNKNGQISGVTVTDPGAYSVLPPLTGVSATTTDCSSGSGAQFNLAQGCFTWPATPISGRTYCSINLSGNFAPGNYYTTGNITGSGNTGATAVSSGTAPPGVTFFQSGGGSISITGNANYNLCAPGTVASGHQCDNTSQSCNAAAGSCILFIQKATLPGSASTVNDFSGTQASVFSGLIYLPDETFRSGGNGTVGGCFGVIAQYVLVQGTPTFSDGCLPGQGIGGTPSQTVTSLTDPRLHE